MSIYIVSHKEFKPPQNPFYVPIYVGTKKNELVKSGGLTDDFGKNIAFKNSNYCELTALYTMYNNLNDDILGLVHYRRYFVKSLFSPSAILDEKTIKNTLLHYDVIVPNMNYSSLTIREEYTADGSGLLKDLDILEDVLVEKYPEYLDVYRDVIYGHKSYLYNMFIMSRENTITYCDWLFDVLFEVEKRTDLTGYTTQQLRIYGYMSERLLTCYILKNKFKVKEFQVINTDKSYSSEILREVKRRIKKLMYRS